MLHSLQRSTVQGLQLYCTSSTPLQLKVGNCRSAILMTFPVCKSAACQHVVICFTGVMGIIEGVAPIPDEPAL